MPRVFDDSTAPTVAFLEIGHRDCLGNQTLIAQSAVAFQLLSGMVHVVAIDLRIGGFDQDERELWDIPEVVGHVFKWMRATKVLPTDPKVTALSQVFLKLCFLRHMGVPVEVEFVPEAQVGPTTRSMH